MLNAVAEMFQIIIQLISQGKIFFTVQILIQQPNINTLSWIWNSY